MENDSNTDPFDLQRLVDAQESVYARVLAELKAGQKRSHWMWYIFPQLDGLGRSPTAKRYAIKSVDEAQAYLNHPILGARLQECAEILLELDGSSAAQIFGFIDEMKLKSSVTLFATAAKADSVFIRVLEKYFHGEQDSKTLELLESL